MTNSALYPGRVVHVRHKPVRHRLTYRAFYMLLDLDELRDVSRRLRLFSLGRFNLVSFRATDHGDASATPLRAQVEAALCRAGVTPDGGPIRLLCMPRVLGLVFNPLSIYFCHRRDGGLAAILYEVNNTFGERHSYMIPVTGNDGEYVQQSCAKEFYVSPFMAMAMQYRFRLAVPAEKLGVTIDADDDEGPVLTAVLDGLREDLTDRNLWRAFVLRPLLAVQVLGAIHWEALKLWRKGMRLVPHPKPPADPVSISRPEEPA